MPKQEIIINEQAEEAVVACIVSDSGAAEVAFELCDTDDFQTKFGRAAFAGARILWDTGKPIDEVTVSHGYFNSDRSAFADWLGRAVVRLPTAARVESYCRNLQETTQRRSLHRMACALLDGASTGDVWGTHRTMCEHSGTART